MKRQFITIWCVFITCLTHAQGFNKAQGQAKDISLDKKGRVFIIGMRNNQLTFNTRQKRFVSFEGTQPEATQPTATFRNPNYNRYTNNSSRSRRAFYYPHDDVLDLLKSQKYLDVCLTGKDAVWVIKSDGKIYYRYNGSLRPLNKGGANNRRIAAVDGNKFYTVKRDNSIWEYKNGRGTKLSGAALDISLDHRKNKLYVIGKSNRIFIRNTVKNRWELISNTRNDFKKLSVNNAVIWAVTTNGNIYSNAIHSAVYDYQQNTGNRDYKIKVTLLHLSCKKAWDNDKKDDYMVSFKANVKGTKSFNMKNRSLNRISTIVKSFGTPNSLYIKRNKGNRDHARVQLHVPEKRSVNINNSGVFEIPTYYVNKGNVSLEVIVSADEVSERITPVLNKTNMLNLKEIVSYLSGKKPIGRYKEVKSVPYSFTRGNTLVSGRSIYYDMGRGYESVNLTKEGNRLVANVTVSGSKSKSVWGSTKTTQPDITYRLELVE
ncbi:hypothetical protein GTQ40_17160 [Flavobacteriaceae bacterium R38]|nr:hypothetical protein [Flavobacteriaceae bacterium R38]